MYADMQREAQAEMSKAISYGMGIYLAVLASVYFAGVGLKNYLAAKATEAPVVLQKAAKSGVFENCDRGTAMKTKYVGLFGFAVLALILTGCSKVKGTYACKGGIFLQSVTLGSGDQAIVTGNVFGSIQQKTGTYKVDGDNVTITVDGRVDAIRLQGQDIGRREMVRHLHRPIAFSRAGVRRIRATEFTPGATSMKLLRYLGRAGVLLPMIAVLVGAQQDQGEWISLCSKCLSPSVSSKTGAGTTSAVAQGRVTLKDAEMWCGSWEPDNKACPEGTTRRARKARPIGFPQIVRRQADFL